MADHKRPPINFDPRAAILLNQQKFVLKITVDMTSGQMVMTTEGPEMNFLAVCDLLTTQVSVILRQALANAMAGKPGFVPPEGIPADKSRTQSTDGSKQSNANEKETS